MPRSFIRAALLVVLAPALVLGQARAVAATPRKAPAHGFAADRLQRVDSFLQAYVDSGRIAGAVALVLRDGAVVYDRAIGFADRESGKRMTSDAIFRIASQSKALTTVAIMMLVEEGKIALNNPVSLFIPAYAKTTVASPGEMGVTRPARRQITIRDLLTHTAGISYGTDSIVRDQYSAKGLGPAAGWGWYTADKDEPICTTMERLATLPFVRQPGEAFVYGYNTDILGCVVERASGMPLDRFIQERITRPLGMRDTWFFLPRESAGRLVTLYATDNATRRAVRAPDGARGQGHYVEGPRMSFAGGAGLVSTARDYARLLQMLLNGGELDGVRLLSPKTVEVMTADQTEGLYTQPGMGFGFGFSIVERHGADNTLLTPGTWGWGGAYGSQYRVDPKERIVLVFMLNQLPNGADVWPKLANVIYGSLR